MKNIGKKVMGAGVATLLVTSVASLNAGAVEVTDYKSYAEAQYIAASGVLLGDQLVDPLADFLEGGGFGGEGAAGATAQVDTAAGTPAVDGPNHVESPLGALDALTGPLGDLLGAGVGPVGSYAFANQDQSIGAAGLVTADGIVNVGDFDAADPLNASLSLTGPGMPLEALSALANVSLVLGAVGSSTEVAAGAPTVGIHDYGIAGGALIVDVPVLANILAPLGGIGDIDLVGIVGIGGVDELLASLTTVTGTGLNIDLTTGQISIELEPLLQAAGLDINDLPANTALLPTVIEGVLAQLPTLVSGLTNGILDGVAALTVTLVGQELPLGEVLDGTLGALLRPLVEAIVNPLLTAVGDALTGPLTQVLEALEPLADIRVNVQETNPGSYLGLVSDRLETTENVFSTTALRVTLLSVVGGEPALAINLGNSLAGANSANTYDDQTNADTTNANENVNVNENQNANANVNLNANGGSADKAVDTLPSTGASNLWPFWLLGLLLVALGTAAMVNEKRRSSALLA